MGGARADRRSRLRLRGPLQEEEGVQALRGCSVRRLHQRLSGVRDVQQRRRRRLVLLPSVRRFHVLLRRGRLLLGGRDVHHGRRLQGDGPRQHLHHTQRVHRVRNEHRRLQHTLLYADLWTTPCAATAATRKDGVGPVATSAEPFPSPPYQRPRLFRRSIRYALLLPEVRSPRHRRDAGRLLGVRVDGRGNPDRADRTRPRGGHGSRDRDGRADAPIGTRVGRDGRTSAVIASGRDGHRRLREPSLGSSLTLRPRSSSR